MFESFKRANTAVLVGAYDSLVGAWPLVSMASFVSFTGLNHHLNVVSVVAFAWLSLGLALLALHQNPRAVKFLGIASTIAGGSLAIAEVVLVLLGQIPPIFLVQVVAELVIGMTWMATFAMTHDDRLAV